MFNKKNKNIKTFCLNAYHTAWVLESYVTELYFCFILYPWPVHVLPCMHIVHTRQYIDGEER